MAPNPIIVQHDRPVRQSKQHESQEQTSLSVVAACLTVLASILLAWLGWSKTWISSGAALESALLLYGSLDGSLHLRTYQLWILLAIVNLSFAVSLTSWLLRPVFIALCWTALLPTCFVVFPTLLVPARKLARTLAYGHIFQDKIAFFHLPALAIDTHVNGLFVARAITISMSDLTIDAHGLELGLRVSENLELALSCDHVTIQLFRQINISDVYTNLKTEEKEMSFDLGPGTRLTSGHKDSFLQRTGAGSDSSRTEETDYQDESTSKDETSKSSVPKKFRSTSKPPMDDAEAERWYNRALKQIETSSQIHVARNEIEQGGPEERPKNEREMRQAVCAKLRDVPSVSHTPEKAISVSLLQRIFPRTRRFLHRLPFLLRLTLNVLSYFHPIKISSISVAGAGERLKGLLESHMFQGEVPDDQDMKQLEEEMSSWLESASFCCEIASLDGLCQVPIKVSGQILAYLRSGNVSVFRTPIDSNLVTQVTHIGGADATFVLPGYLLPHHEHAVPSRESSVAGSTSASSDNHAHEEADETEMTFSMHASLPTYFDQSLLDFASTLVKATKLIDLENLFEQQASTNSGPEEQSTPATDNEEHESNHNESNNSSTGDSRSQFSKLADRTRQSVKEGIKKGAKKNAVGDRINDRWIAKSVSRIAARLESAHGDFGYTTTRAISLKPYRAGKDLPSKILP